MIITIIGTVILVVSIAGMIIGYKNREKNIKYTDLFVHSIIAFSLVLIIVPSVVEGGGYNQNYKYFKDKEMIIAKLEENPNEENINDAVKYNKRVDKYNNLWLRFDVEDRTDYKIDISKYVG